MIRGIYTGASGMIAQQVRLDAISNNLANVDLNGYKRDVAVHKSFPELLIRRLDDDGVSPNPMGSQDNAPYVGKLGLGVETNELFTEFEQGPLKQTDGSTDFALDGKGFFCVETPYGERYTRNGNFVIGKEGWLETKEGYRVLGQNGPLNVKENNFMVDKKGNVYINRSLQDDPYALVAQGQNTWDRTELLDTLKIVDFKRDRWLDKQGSSLWKSTELSGEAQLISDPTARPAVQQGFVEGANVNPVTEMVQMIEVNRAYEANQKSVQQEDAMLGKLVNEVVKY
jgi:flagellar basal-body rod protein FlgF